MIEMARMHHDMSDETLLRTLRSIGFEAFVVHFALFTDPTTSTADRIDRLRRLTPWTEKSCRSRTGHAARIAAAGRIDDALALVASAGRVPDEVSGLARRLLIERPT